MSRTNLLTNVAIVYSERRLSANECRYTLHVGNECRPTCRERMYMSGTNVHIGNESSVECICEFCKANCVITNETVCGNSLCLMWPHGLSVWRRGLTAAGLFPLHVRTAGSNRRSGDRFCRHHVSSRRHCAHIGSLSCESPGESSFR